MELEKKFSIAKEGAPFIIPLFVLCLVLSLLEYKISSYIFGIFGIAVALFFRDPGRIIPEGENIVVAPADGKVISVKEDNEDIFVKGKVTRISIFLSIFNVHINRIPLSGIVKYFQYQKGRFIPAYEDNAYIANEQNIIGIENKKIKYLFRQITGLVARRVVFRGKIGDFYDTGEKFGLMKFGSRMDIYLPENVKVLVKKGDTVKAGLSIIGEIS